MLGISTATASDEFVVGAPKQDSNGTDSGSVFVYSGATGAQIHKHDGDAAGDQFGFAAAGVGDVSNNGTVDYAIGAPFNNNAGANAGRVKFFDGINFGLIKTIDGDAAGDRFGSAISTIPIGDFVGGVAIGAPYNNSNGANSGRVNVYWSQGLPPAYTLNGNSAGDLFGTSIANVWGNRLLVGSPGNNSATGSASLVNSVTGATVHTFHGLNPGEQFGASVAYGGQQGSLFGGFTYSLLIGSPLHSQGAHGARRDERLRSRYLYIRGLYSW